MNTLRLRIVVSGVPYDTAPITRKAGETDKAMGLRALTDAVDFVKTNQLGDFESITPIWST